MSPMPKLRKANTPNENLKNIMLGNYTNFIPKQKSKFTPTTNSKIKPNLNVITQTNPPTNTLAEGGVSSPFLSSNNHSELFSIISSQQLSQVT